MVRYNITFNNQESCGDFIQDYFITYDNSLPNSNVCNCSLAGTETCQKCTNNPANQNNFQDSWTSSLPLTDPQKEQLKKLLEELANTPILKIPFWIEAHKKELQELGVTIKPDIDSNTKDTKKKKK